MGYLEQLKKQAQVRQTKESEIQQQRARQEAIFDSQVKPALKRLFLYLHELIQQLNYLEPDTSVSYHIAGYGKEIDFKQKNYRVLPYTELEALGIHSDETVKDQKNLTYANHNLVLRCHCQMPYKIRIKRYNKSDMERQKKYFVKHRIPFTCTEENDENHKLVRAVFLFGPLIYVEFYFAGRVETSTIDLTVTNFTELGKKIYTLLPKQINEPWLDELGKYLTRQPNKLQLVEKAKFLAQQKNTVVPTIAKKLETSPPITEKEPEPLSRISDHEEFDEWLRSQEQKLAAEQTEVVKKPKLFSFFKKLGSR